MVHCKKCGSKIKENEAFCPDCGEKNEQFTTHDKSSEGSAQEERYIPQSYQQAKDDLQPGLRKPEQTKPAIKYDPKFEGELSAPVRSWGIFFAISIIVQIVGFSVIKADSVFFDSFRIFFVPFGIIYAIYIYLNFSDLRLHISKIHSEEEEMVADTPLHPLIASGIVLSVIPIQYIALLSSTGDFDLGSLPISSFVILQFIMLTMIFIKHKTLYEHLENHGEVDRGKNGGEAIIISIITFMLGTIYLDWKWQNVFNRHVKKTAGFSN